MHTPFRAKPQRIAILGPESSGKTTLIQTLALELNAFTVPEYFRFYWEAKRYTKNGATWHEDEFVHLASEQNRFEDLYASQAGDILLCDTNALQIAAWERRYLGKTSKRVLSLAQKRPYDLLLLCRPDIPFVQDGVRDGEKIRADMFTWLTELLDGAHLAYDILAGEKAERLACVQEKIASLRAGTTAEKR